MSLVYNERVKLLATALNNLKIASVGTGFIAPTTSYIFGVTATSGDRMIALCSAWLASGMLLMVAARHTLGSLKE